MDKTWMNLSRYSHEYGIGLQSFIDFAFEKVGNTTGKIPCPCRNCVNGRYQVRSIVREHLICDGFMPNYVHWLHHGEDELVNHVNVEEVPIEQSQNEDEHHMNDLINDLFRDHHVEKAAQATNYEKYMVDANKPLYPGCEKETILSFMIWLFNHKNVNKWTDISIDGLLSKLKSFSIFANLPDNFYEMKKMVSSMGFSYENIDACQNDCMLFWKESEKLDSCKVCEASRWKTVRSESEIQESIVSNQTKVANKQLRYLPLIPRLQRLFMSKDTAEHMTWHAVKRREDGVNRHPADSLAWKHFDAMNVDFSKEHRNVRIGLSTDGMSPFKHGSPHSIWPVTVVVYNLPPWICMKQEFLIMPLLIPGPNSPTNDVDVYLSPLIEELKILWNIGVETYDAFTNTKFNMRAALLWTISDFPGLSMLSGWSTKGKLACPSCMFNTRSCRLQSKECYIGHRCFLDKDHSYRSDKRRFNGQIDHSESPKILDGFEIFENVKDINITFGKTIPSKKTVPHDPNHNWRKKSIFFELSYWKTLLLRHNLDVMHIEKNVCESLMGTLLGLPKKNKDGLKARLDLVKMGIRPELHPKPRGSQYQLPAASYTLSRKEKQGFLELLKNIKVPDSYASNISRCINVKECTISNLKSHDCHILMQQLLPIALRGTNLSRHVCLPIIELCTFFRELCSSENRSEDFKRLSKKIPLILCKLEMVFPPAFFDIMVHLPIHLAEEARIAGNVKYRQMWVFERYMGKIKAYIRNRSRPEGSIVQGYIAQECVTFCSRYLSQREASWIRPSRNEDGFEQGGLSQSIFNNVGRFLGTPKACVLSNEDVMNAHLYVLFNSDEIDQYLRIWENSYLLRRGRRKQKPLPREIDNARRKEFPGWFKNYIRDIKNSSEEVKAISLGPNVVGRRGDGYLINGYRFHTLSCERKRQTQNSGVYLEATTRGYASAKDQNPKEGVIEYFGILEDVIELDYYGYGKIVLFKCKWYDSVARDIGVKVDDYGFTVVNNTKIASSDEPFVLPSQVQQIFYVDDQRDSNWRVVVRTKPRDFCADAEAELDSEDSPGHHVNTITQVEEIDAENITWSRDGIDDEIVENVSQSIGPRVKRRRIQDIDVEYEDEDGEEEEEEGAEEEDEDECHDDEVEEGNEDEE